MNILLIISSLEVGGAEKQTVLDANLLSEKHRVFLFFFREGMLKTLVNGVVVAEQIEKKGYLATAWRLREKIRALEIDVIHASLFAPIVISTLASLGTKAKVVWHFHSHEYDIPLKSKLAFQWLARLPHVRRILFVNHELMHYFAALKFPRSKTGVHYNHSELSVPEAGSGEVPSSQEAVQIGYLGRVIELKRIHYLVELAEYFLACQLRAFNIHVVGDGEALSAVRALAEEKGVAAQLVFHGFQVNTVDYYRQFDFFVNPSREECLSIAMIDAGMMGLPIVAFDVGGNNEIVVDGKTGYIVTDKAAFFDRCLLLAQDKSRRAELGAASRQHCQNHFSKEKHADAFQDLYAAIVAAH